MEINSSTPFAGLTDGAPARPAAPGQEVDKQMFLKLLVAQVRNQNPLNPADGIQFLTQLAQFTSLEQQAAVREDVEAIRAVLTGEGQPATAAGK